MPRRWCITAAALALACLTGCNALRKTTECDAHLDCPRGSSCAIESGYCRTGAPITVGFLAATNGPQAALTEERRVALDFGRWLVERDPQRKVLGRGIEFLVEDTLGAIPEVPAATTRLLDANVAAIIGPGPSAEVLEAQKLTGPRQVLHLAPSGGAPALGEAQPQNVRQRFLFQMVLGVRDFVATVPLFLADTRRPASYDACFDGMAIVVSDDALGLALEAALKEILDRNCVKVTRSITVPATRKSSYAQEIDALVAAENAGRPTRCVFLGLSTDVAGEVLRALKERERSGTREPYTAFLGAGTLNAERFFEDAKSPVAGEPSFAEGFYGIDADANPDRPELRDIEKLWEQYLATQSVVPPGTPLGPNRISFTEAVVVLALAMELAGTASDPVALRDALVDITDHAEGDRILGPNDLPTAFAQIRAAREDGRRAAIDYQGSYSNLDFDDRGFVRTGTLVWHARNGQLERAMAFREEQVSATAAANPGPACARRP